MSLVHDDDRSDVQQPTDFDAVVASVLSRRGLLKAGGAVASLGFLTGFAGKAGALAPGAAMAPPARPTAGPKPLLGFSSVPLVAGDDVVVPPGYTAEVLFAWGDPVSNGPAFLMDASQGWAEQEVQSGMHHDGLFFYALPNGSGSLRGLLCINHEYTDAGLLYSDGMATWTPVKVRKALAAHGVSVIEVKRVRQGRTWKWQVVRPSRYARRITGYTPIDIVGPAAGSPLLQTAADPTGKKVLGTLNNCGSGTTPWNTYLTCEENFNGYFGWDGTYTPTVEQQRYGITATGFGYRWHEQDPRFNVRLNPNEPNRHGWVVEFDPFNAKLPIRKLTALGRFKHESAAVAITHDQRAVVYSGDDERNNYVYKFVGKESRHVAARHGRSPLQEGTLYVARFDAGAAPGDWAGTGEWIPLTPAHPNLAGKTIDWILVNTRNAADLVGATRMDRPEWITIAKDGQVYMTLTNNSRRGRTTTNPSENPNSVVDEANPRSATGQGNPYGHIIRWKENGGPEATTFTWDIFVLAGDPANPAALDGVAPGGNIVGDIYGSPDGIWADKDGRIWIQTDISASTLGSGPYANIPNNMMLAADPNTFETRRFLVGPRNCEVTGVHTTADGKTMFVSIQHPGESPSEVSDPNNPQQYSSWPDHLDEGRPRSATIVITKDDGGKIGT